MRTGSLGYLSSCWLFLRPWELGGVFRANPLLRMRPISTSRHRGLPKGQRPPHPRRPSIPVLGLTTVDCLYGSSHNSIHISEGLFLRCRSFVYCWNLSRSVVESLASRFVMTASREIWQRLPCLPYP